MIGYCGLNCDTCPIHLATIEPDIEKQKNMRETIAREIERAYGTVVTPEEINDCDGCRAESGRLFTGCLDCKIRACAIEKQIESCGLCSEYICDRLKDFLQKEPVAKNRLEEIRDANPLK
ncbi:DUF3795 domain-containing protein [Parabacteroides sp. FAFU027]|uniref:DUF3795 domain-containing protein n=1 Tax=Parabacteroides sp. FAFU027 TaxID=2922715 RepID=UPI001FAEF70E|nr:DUF3795 domain-containing protein [Parabacteroides sp. FAFU027]